MLLKIKYIIATAILSATMLSASAQTPAHSSDSDIRVSPKIEFSEEEVEEIPTFIHLKENKIDMNGADWSALKKKIAYTDSSVFTIVHIGDSHIQADFCTGKTRALLQSCYGSAGRGLIVPLKLAGTNEPRDYIIKSNSLWQSSKMMKPNENVTLGFTGVGISPIGTKADLTIATLSRTGDAEPFDMFKIYHQGKLLIDSVSSLEKAVSFSAIYTDSVTTVRLPDAVTGVTLDLSVEEGTAIYGIILTKCNKGGILYNAIGNNGATYHSYTMLPESARHIGDINPDLIIVSLGANEAFSRMTPEEMRESIDRLVSSLRRCHPGSEILLTTPMECQKSVRIRRKGKKRSRRTYAVNEKVLTARNIILDYARDHGVPVYDWYEVAGGTGVSKSWINAGLMAKDRIHHSYKGYRLQGGLLFDALNNSLQ